ncbi:lipid asymmetry maintenance protein MlaB [Vibrio fluvialis]|nr:lipid asymmetry maintenance protein MlaB [Vibrio fluvialis]
MSHPQWQQRNPEQAELSGALDRDTVPGLWTVLQQWQLQGAHCELSLKSVTRIDSAGMVMLIHLLEHAKKQNCHIMLSFVPEQLRTLFQLSNIDAMMSRHIKQPAGVNCG